jgi:hypothetical protein
VKYESSRRIYYLSSYYFYSKFAVNLIARIVA